MEENNKNTENKTVLYIIIAIIIIGGIWYFSTNRNESIKNCAVRQQDRDLQTFFYDKGLTPSTADLLETYEAAEADCRI